MYEKPDFDAVAWLRDIDDADERARFIRENGWCTVSDPEISSYVLAQAAQANGDERRLLAAAYGAPKITRKQQSAARKAARILARAKLRPKYAKAYGEPSLGPPSSNDEEPLVNAAVSVGAAMASAAVPQTNQSETVPVATPAPQIFHWDEDLTEFLRDIVIEGGHRPRPAPAPLNGAVNPFAETPKKLRSSDLTADDAVKIYEAISFAMAEHGAVMTSHVVILWDTYRVRSHEQATDLLSEYLNQARKWARVGTPGQSRERRRQRTGEGFDFRFVYVHENGTQRGFHTHILCTVPRSAAKAFEAWTKAILARLTRYRGDGRSVRVVSSLARNEQSAVARGWNWFRYISKQLSPEAGIGRIDERPKPLREILKVWPYRTALPISCMKRVGGSKDIWTKAQRDAGFRSDLKCRDVGGIFSGHEMDEHRQQVVMRELLPTLNY